MCPIHENWEKKAIVATKSKPILNAADKGYFYPLSRQPLSFHPLVEDLGTDAIAYLLTQSFYKYNNDIAIIETRLVSQAILNATNDKLLVKFTRDQKLDLFTVLVDEAYHAYVAFDAMQKVEQHTGIKPLPLPDTLELELATQAVKKTLPAQYHTLFDFIVVCLAENTLTKDIVGMMDREETHPFFQQLITEHLVDESRHAGLFFHLLKAVWSELSKDYRKAIGAHIPEFLARYLSSSIQMDFEKSILNHLGLSDGAVDEVMQDTYGGIQLTSSHPMLKNIMTVLTKAEVFDSDIAAHFKEKEWV